MPEEKKKESFTFSDKIKSKNASKTFANRMPSKIGSDGKPRQTLFERTKRDAPFLIAALVAVLLLPFLYKYSGHIEDDVPMITPGYEDSIVNPDRSGFDLSGDPEGQISQLSGRDSMDLIVGLGKRNKEEETTDSLADIYRSGLADSSKASSYRRNDMDEEENTTNIYRYRKNAAPQTRAAFRRANTKIGALKGAGVPRTGGGLRVTNWGGSMKGAAQKVRGAGQRNSPKPVSLQPLQAAGKPSRSYFGNGAAREAQRSKDAMSKSNAMQALMDAQVKPVEPTRLGGIMGGDFGGPGGGNGNLHREFAFNGKEPWWWDMMKTREQMRWQKWFEFQWSIVNWAKDWFLGRLEGVLNCLAVGNSDGDPDTILGSGGGSGSKDATCCGFSAKKLEPMYGEIKDLKSWCTSVSKKRLANDLGLKSCEDYKPGYGGGDVHLSGWQMRKKCLGAVVGGSLREVADCRNMKNLYQVNPTGEARNWHTYVYVVARNYLPESSDIRPEGSDAKRRYLCTKESDHLRIGAEVSAGAGYRQLEKPFDGQHADADFNAGKEDQTARTRRTKDAPLVSDMAEINPENPEHGCVIYVQKGDTFNYDNFQTTMIEQFSSLLKKQGMDEENIPVAARNAFNQLDLMFVGSFSAKKKLAARGWFGIISDGDAINPPILYWRFYDGYVRHQRTSSGRNSALWRLNVDKRKLREEGVNFVEGQSCWFNDTVTINCDDVTDGESVPTATVTFKQGYKGKAKPDFDATDVTVTATYTPLSGVNRVEPQRFTNPDKGQTTLEYAFTNILVVNKDGDVSQPDALQGSVRWDLERNGEIIDYAVCAVNTTGDKPVSVTSDKQCANDQESQQCCLQIHANETGWKWDASHEPKCYKPTTDNPVDPGNPSVTTVRLAPRLSWVPTNPTGRLSVQDGQPITAQSFTDKYLGNVDGQDQHCGTNTPLQMDSTAAKEYVSKVVAAYNAKYPDKPISWTETWPTDGEFVDALNIAASENLGGLQTVAAAAVCELGRDMVRMSQDPHTIGQTIPASVQSVYAAASGNKSDQKFHNDLGAFLIYVHPTAMFYPASRIYKKVDQKTVSACDMRFLALKGGGCAPNTAFGTGSNVDSRFHYTNYHSVYTDIKEPGKIWSVAYEPSLREIGLTSPTNPPLKGLVQNNTVITGLKYEDCGNGVNCASRADKYKVQIDSLLGEASSFVPWTGNACQVFFGGNGPDLQVRDVLTYVTTVCKQGLDKKPRGVGKERGSHNARAGSGQNRVITN